MHFPPWFVRNPRVHRSNPRQFRDKGREVHRGVSDWLAVHRGGWGGRASAPALFLAGVCVYSRCSSTSPALAAVTCSNTPHEVQQGD